MFPFHVVKRDPKNAETEKAFALFSRVGSANLTVRNKNLHSSSGYRPFSFSEELVEEF
jgi:hypothetical protein